jgi:hypothetical protein
MDGYCDQFEWDEVSIQGFEEFIKRGLFMDMAEKCGPLPISAMAAGGDHEEMGKAATTRRTKEDPDE